MKILQKTIIAVALVTLIFSSNLFAQSANAAVKIKLMKSLAISNQGLSEIDFEGILVTPSAQTPSVSVGSQNGAHFLVTGHPGKYVSVVFSTVELNNDTWVATNGGTESTMTFTPAIEETGKTSTYSSGNVIISGSAQSLENDKGTGNLNLWVGGTMSVGGNQSHGDYEGVFSVSVAYN